jgi:terminal uridylyltransferase
MGGEVPLEAAFSAAAAARSPQKKRSPWTTEALQRRREQASPWAPRVDVVIHSVLHDLQETAVCQHRQKRLTQRLDRILKDVYGEQAVLKVFGSTVCSLACKNSDLDMTFTPGRSKSLSISEKKTALRKVAKELQSHGMRAVPVLGARVPIVKIRDQSDTWLAVDLSVENDLPVFKSRLLHEYTLIDARFAKLVQLVKAWAKTRQINSAAQGTFNSFGLSLLVLHYLQNVEPPVLPRLNEATLELRGDARLRAAVGVSDTRLFAKPARVLGTCDGITICHHTHQHLVGWGSENIASLAALTRGFFEYYSRHFSWDRQVVSVTLPGMVLKSSVAFHEGQQTNVCIQDPLDQSDNCARR